MILSNVSHSRVCLVGSRFLHKFTLPQCFIFSKHSTFLCESGIFYLILWINVSKEATTAIKINMSMYWTNFWRPTINVQQDIFEKTLIAVGSSHLYASFGTFCVQIDKLCEAQWVFEKCLKTVKSLFFEGKWSQFRILLKVWNVPKDCKDVSYQLL